MAGTQYEILQQEDVLYRSNRGKLKLRLFPEGTGDLIFYTREEKGGPKLSDYSIYRTENASELKSVLDQSFETAGIVKKTRKLYMKGRTRIHLDSVENLGEFLELEVVLNEGEDRQNGIDEAREIMAFLQIDPADLLDKAYIDLLMDCHPAQGIRS